MRHTNSFLFAALLAVLTSRESFAQADDLFLETPPVNTVDADKNKNIESAVKEAKKKGFHDEFDRPPYRFSVYLGGGAGISRYKLGGQGLRMTVPENLGFMVGAGASILAPQKDWGVGFEFRQTNNFHDPIRTFTPRTGIRIIRERFALRADKRVILGTPLFAGLGLARWRRDGTATKRRNVVSHYTAWGPTFAVGTIHTFGEEESFVLSPQILMDYAIRYDEQTQQTGNSRVTWIGEGRVSARYSITRSISVELQPFIRLDQSIWKDLARGRSVGRETENAIESDLYYGMPLFVHVSF
jgi:hypothetical protein